MSDQPETPFRSVLSDVVLLDSSVGAYRLRARLGDTILCSMVAATTMAAASFVMVLAMVGFESEDWSMAPFPMLAAVGVLLGSVVVLTGFLIPVIALRAHYIGDRGSGEAGLFGGLLGVAFLGALRIAASLEASGSARLALAFVVAWLTVETLLAAARSMSA